MKTRIFSVFAALALAVNVNAATTAELLDLLVSLGLIDASAVSTVEAALGSDSSDSCALKTAADMTVGSQGAGVVELQNFLVDGGYLVMPAGVAMGYFGGLTQSALASYQAAMGISPAAGYFGPVTKASISCDDSSDDSSSDDSDDSSELSGGEGDITVTKNSSPSSEDLSEGDEVEVYSVEVEAEDSDVRVERMDFYFDVTSGSDDLWDAIDSAILYVDGDEVVEIDDLDDEDEWTEVDSDTWKLRVTNIDVVVEEDEEVDFELALVAQSNIDESDYGNSTDFTVYVPANGVRATDGIGIDVYGAASALGNATVDVTEPTEADVTLLESDDNPDASIIVVDDENKTRDVEVLVFEIEVDDDGIVIDNLHINATSTLAAVDTLIDELAIEIDGQTFEGDIDSTTASSTFYNFDIDKDVEIDGDDTIEVVVTATFNKQDGNYATSGEAVSFGINGNTTDLDAETDSTGDNLASSQIAGTVEGNTHTVSLVGIDVEVTDIEETVTSVDGGNGDYVSIVFDVTIANNGDETVYVPLAANVLSGSTGFNFASTSSAVGTTTVNVNQKSDRTETSNSVRIQSGQDADIQVSVTFNSETDVYYGLELVSVSFSETAGGTDLTFTAPDTSEFESDDPFLAAE